MASAILTGTLLTLALVNTAAAVVMLRQLHRNLDTIHRLQAKVAHARSVARKAQLDRDERQERKDALAQAVDGGTNTVEIVHQAISASTFSVIDKLSRSRHFRATSEQVRQIHDGTSQGVYRSIRVANREIHSLADVFLKQRQRDKKSDADEDDPN